MAKTAAEMSLDVQRELHERLDHVIECVMRERRRGSAASIEFELWTQSSDDKRTQRKRPKRAQ